jgi:hydroxymethylpyrimidine/phosphomethylpyrimidine kinase
VGDSERDIKVALTIAGSDSGGGAGIQADLKAFASLGLHGTCAITALTAQNTREVISVAPVAPEMVLAQIRAVLADFHVAAVKVGMLGTAEVTRAVAAGLSELAPGTPVVVDPVMVAESGGRLLAQDAEGALIEEILPRASVLTPNLPEARVLLGRAQPADRAHEAEEAVELARSILTLGPGAVVLTGGHRQRIVDLLAAPGAELVEIEGLRHPDGAAHGSGCTHSSVLAGALALGQSLEQAARTARRLAGDAVGRGLREIGAGAGPVDVLDLGGRSAGG